MSVLDLGGLYVGAIFVYSVIPLLGFLLLGENADLLDNRLLVLNPELSDIAKFAWRYPFFLGVFTCFYLFFRTFKQDEMEVSKPPQQRVMLVAAVWAAGAVYQQALYLIFGVKGESGYDNITEVYQQLQSLPSLVQQLTNVVNGLVLMSRLYLLTALFANHKSWTARIILLLWIGGEFALNVITFASRTPLFLLLLSSLGLFTKTVRRLSVVALLTLGLVSLSGFLLWGLLRATPSGDAQGQDELAVVSALRNRNEFQACFTTAYDIYAMRQQGGLSIPMSLHFADLLRILPQQIVPFKVDPAEWYLEQKGVTGTGQGYGYGLISESVVGLGYFHLFCLGLALAYTFARIHNSYLDHAREPLAVSIYLWFCIKAYTFFRMTSFSFLGYFFYGVLPFILLLRWSEEPAPQTATDQADP